MGDDNGLGPVVVILVAVFVAGVAMGSFAQRKLWRAESVERGFAEHNQTTGEWQWKPSEAEKGRD